MRTPEGTYAIVREVPRTFDAARRPAGCTAPIDVELARRQHRRYCEILQELGLGLIRLPADDRYPDCCFVEDIAIIVGGKAIVAAPGAASRRGETEAIEPALRGHKRIHRIEAPATLDGGDVLRAGDRFFVGLSTRSNQAAVDQLAAIIAEDGVEVRAVPVRGVLHLKSACTYLGDGHIVYRPGHFDESILQRYRKIPVPESESYAANCLAINGRVLVPAGASETRARIEAVGFSTIEVDISESRKAAGGLTCSSIIL